MIVSKALYQKEISQGAHMANILKDDVATYVRELIEKEFLLNRVEEKSFSQNSALNKGVDHEIKQPGQRRRYVAQSEW
jgi:hypothetical protein